MQQMGIKIYFILRPPHSRDTVKDLRAGVLDVQNLKSVLCRRNLPNRLPYIKCWPNADLVIVQKSVKKIESTRINMRCNMQ